MMGTGMIGGIGFMLLCSALGIALVAGAVWLVLRTNRGAPRTRPNSRELERDEDYPSQLLRRRYAAGEIDEDEYLRRLSGISQP